MSGELSLFGKIVRTHGNNGALIIKQDSFSKVKLRKTEPLFVNFSPTPVPYFIETLKTENNGFNTVKLEWVNTPEQADKLCGLDVFVERKTQKKSDKEIELNDLIGFIIVDKQQGEIGSIVEIIELPQQQLFSINSNGKQILIPIVEEFISGIETKEKKVHISVPEGLINLYLK